MSGLAALRPRALAASIAGALGAALFLFFMGGRGEPSLAIPVGALLVAALVAHVPRLGAQLLARALWWSNLMLGLTLCLLGSTHERVAGGGLTLGAGAALLLADRGALVEAGGARGAKPASFAGTVQLVMILALADAQSLLLVGALSARDGLPASAALFFAAAAALVVGFVGLYRLALWGVFVTAGTALALVVVLLGRLVRIDTDFFAPLLVLSALQIVAPLPMLVSVATGRALPAPSPRSRSALGALAVALVMLVGLGAAALR